MIKKSPQQIIIIKCISLGRQKYLSGFHFWHLALKMRKSHNDKVGDKRGIETLPLMIVITVSVIPPRFPIHSGPGPGPSLKAEAVIKKLSDIL